MAIETICGGVIHLRKIIICIFVIQILISNSVNAQEDLGIDLNLEERDVAFTFFDLSNGESTLIQTGEGQNILIDTGSSESVEELEQRLKMYHVKKIDSVILTNQTEEYAGNLNWVVDHYFVKDVIVANPIVETIIQNHEDASVIGWKNSETYELTPQIKTQVMYVEEEDPFNKGALVLLFTFGKHTLLYMSVADEMVERSLMSDYSLKSTILKVADFGDAKGTSQPFLEEVDPQVAILFKKKGKSVSELVLERLQETWIDIYQTYRLGTVSIKCHSNDYEILTVKPPTEDFNFSLANLVNIH